MSIASGRCLWRDGGRAVLPGAAVEPVGGSITGKYQPQGMLMRLFSSMSSDLIVFSGLCGSHNGSVQTPLREEFPNQELGELIRAQPFCGAQMEKTSSALKQVPTWLAILQQLKRSLP